MKTFLIGTAIQFGKWAAKQPQRGIDIFGGDAFAWCILGPGFAFIVGLVLYMIGIDFGFFSNPW